MQGLLVYGRICYLQQFRTTARTIPRVVGPACRATQPIVVNAPVNEDGTECKSVRSKWP